MDEVERIFLTDTRRRFLEEPESFSESAQKTNYYRLRNRARMALEELIEVYQSDRIDNSELVEPRQVGELLNALIGDPDDITPRNEFDGDFRDWIDEYAYEDAVLSEIERASLRWRLILLGTPVETTEAHQEYLEKLGDLLDEDGELPER